MKVLTVSMRKQRMNTAIKKCTYATLYGNQSDTFSLFFFSLKQLPSGDSWYLDQGKK